MYPRSDSVIGQLSWLALPSGIMFLALAMIVRGALAQDALVPDEGVEEESAREPHETIQANMCESKHAPGGTLTQFVDGSSSGSISVEVGQEFFVSVQTTGSEWMCWDDVFWDPSQVPFTHFLSFGGGTPSSVFVDDYLNNSVWGHTYTQPGEYSISHEVFCGCGWDLTGYFMQPVSVEACWADSDEAYTFHSTSFPVAGHAGANYSGVSVAGTPTGDLWIWEIDVALSVHADSQADFDFFRDSATSVWQTDSTTCTNIYGIDVDLAYQSDPEMHSNLEILYDTFAGTDCGQWIPEASNPSSNNSDTLIRVRDAGLICEPHMAQISAHEFGHELGFDNAYPSGHTMTQDIMHNQEESWHVWHAHMRVLSEYFRD